jgi:hypothetical protein
MTQTNLLVQQHVYDYESGLKHVDEMTTHADTGLSATENGRGDERSAEAATESNRLFDGIEAFKKRHPEQWPDDDLEKIGPMVVWDTVAQQLEKLVEHLEH